VSDETDDHPFADLAETLDRSGWRVPDELPNEDDDVLGLTVRRWGQEEYLHIHPHVMDDHDDYPDWRARVRRPNREVPLVSSGSGMTPETAARDAGVELEGGDDSG
jgi:hypothetical protein